MVNIGNSAGAQRGRDTTYKEKGVVESELDILFKEIMKVVKPVAKAKYPNAQVIQDALNPIKQKLKKLFDKYLEPSLEDMKTYPVYKYDAEHYSKELVRCVQTLSLQAFQASGSSSVKNTFKKEKSKLIIGYVHDLFDELCPIMDQVDSSSSSSDKPVIPASSVDFHLRQQVHIETINPSAG